MATYVNDLRLKEIATGDESGTWGTSTNTNLELIAEGFSYATVDPFDTDADKTETMADGATDPIRSLYLKVTSTATLTATRTLTLAPNTVSKVWIIENATTGGQSISISQGSGANVTIPNGDVKAIYTDGAGATAAVTDAFANLKVTDAAQTNITSVGTLTGLAVGGATTVTQSSAATAATFKVGDNSAQVANVVVSNDADIGLNLGVFGSSAGTAGMISASDAFITTSTTELNVGVNNSSGVIKFGVGSTAAEKMRIDGTGVGIGTTSPDDLLHVFAGDSTATASTLSAVNIENNDNVALSFMTPNNKTAQIRFADPQDTGNGIFAYDHNTAAMTFATNGPEKVRITGDGCLLINRTSQIGNPIQGLQVVCGNGSSGAYSFLVRDTTETNNALLIENSGNFYSDFIYNVTTGDAANVNISTSSQVRRSTSSRRYKTNIRDYDKGINAIQTLSPKYFNGINDGDIQFAGLIAEDVHDAGLTEFVQYNADNEPDSLAYNHMIALLVKGIQEQQVLIEQLQAEVALLKGE